MSVARPETARRSRFLGAMMVSVFAGAASLIVISGGGCGGSVTDDSVPEDGGVDTAVAVDSVVVVDSAKESATDTAPATDTATGIDAPGSLFDVDIPDIAFEGGTAAGCYDCTKDLCKSELTACDADAKCRGLVLCIAVTCAGDTTDTTCLLGCLTSSGVGFTDPATTEALAVGQCAQKKCADKCPSVPGGTDGGVGDARGDTVASDVIFIEASPGDGGSGGTDATPAAKSEYIPSGAPMTMDPRVIEALSKLRASFDDRPEVRRAVIDSLSH